MSKCRPISTFTVAFYGLIACTQCMRRSLLLQMSHTAWSAGVSVCALGTRVSCAKTGEPIKMPFGGGADWSGCKKSCTYIRRESRLDESILQPRVATS